MRLGAHIRIAGGLVKALDRARDLGCEAVQLFSGNPNGWAPTYLKPEDAAGFVQRASELGIFPIILHTPYLVNLASPDDVIWKKSVGALSHAIKRAAMLNSDYVVTHIGSHRGSGYEAGVRRIQEAVRLSLNDGQATIALELGSGSGNSIGSRFEQIADIFSGLDDVADRVGICIDCAHLYCAGYDISTSDGVASMFAELDKYVGLERLKVVHLNDTQMQLGCHADRHFHIGEGHIGVDGFCALINYPGLENLPGIIETPGGGEIGLDRRNLDTLRGLICDI